MRTGPLNQFFADRIHQPPKSSQRSADEDRRVVDCLPSEPVVPWHADAVRGHQEDEADEEDPHDRDRVDPLVVLAQRPGARLEPVLHSVTQDHRKDERDVQADHRYPGAHVVADEEVVEGWQHECGGQNADRDDREMRDAVAADPTPHRVSRNRTVAREREQHPRRGGHRRGQAEHLCDAADKEQERPPSSGPSLRPSSRG